MSSKAFYGTHETKALAKRITFTRAPREVYGPEDKCFTITIAGILIGRAYASEETIERRPKGARYVTARWSRPCWRYEIECPHRRHNEFDFPCTSRIRAAVALVNFAIEDGGLFAGVAAELVREVEKEARAAWNKTL